MKTDTPETDANTYRASTLASADNIIPVVHAEFARKLEREREELAVYLCRIKLPLPVRFVADLAKAFPGKNIRMKDVGGYLCIFSENH